MSIDGNLIAIQAGVLEIVAIEGASLRRRARELHGLGEITQKSSVGDLATELDRSVERSLVVQLTRLLPGSSTLGEEAGGGGGESDRLWVIDPIDGTTNVIHGIEHAAISVALLDQGRPVVGVVHHIFTGVSYVASDGGGAWSVAPGGDLRSADRLQASATVSPSNSLVSFGLPYDRGQIDVILSAVRSVFAEVRDLRRSGSAALDLVNIALGHTQAHLEVDLRPWDIAAASLILTECDGQITDWIGNDLGTLGHQKKMRILASSGHVHGGLLALLG